MALFSSLSERLNHIFSKLTKHGRLTDSILFALLK